jgi:UDP-N-acetylglucosamine 2-epimerase (non-hydrolysing)
VRVLSVVDGRPNFMKLAPVDRELAKREGLEHVIVHAGQHDDARISAAFFEELWIPAPDHHLGVGSRSHAQQTAAVMQRLEPILIKLRPDLLLVYGDVNATVGAALVAAKLGVRVGHVEAGLRGGDCAMPEEINRVVTDRLSDLLFLPSRDAAQNLLAEGVPADRLQFVGNVLIDSLCWALPQASTLGAPARHGVDGRPYAVVTLHGPSTVDDPAVLREQLEALEYLGGTLPVLFPVHPRTRDRIRALGARLASGGLRLLEPLGYLEMLGLVAGARLVITDSGCLQDEATFLGVPCLTVRPSTERPITCQHGTNRLVAARRETIVAAAERALARQSPARPLIERWDGRAAQRIVQVVCDGEWFAVDDAALTQQVLSRTTPVRLPLAAS